MLSKRKIGISISSVIVALVIVGVLVSDFQTPGLTVANGSNSYDWTYDYFHDYTSASQLNHMNPFNNISSEAKVTSGNDTVSTMMLNESGHFSYDGGPGVEHATFMLNISGNISSTIKPTALKIGEYESNVQSQQYNWYTNQSLWPAINLGKSMDINYSNVSLKEIRNTTNTNPHDNYGYVEWNHTQVNVTLPLTNDSQSVKGSRYFFHVDVPMIVYFYPSNNFSTTMNWTIEFHFYVTLLGLTKPVQDALTVNMINVSQVI